MIRQAALLFALTAAHAVPALDVWKAKSEVRTLEPGNSVKLTGTRKGDLYQSRLTNTGKTPIHIKEVSLFRIEHNLPDTTALYGESFQMLSQTAGTLGKPVDLAYDELKHYKIPQPADARAVTGMLTLTPPGGETMLLAFTSCRRFNGRFFLRPQSIEVVLDTEGLALAPGESWELEEFTFTSGPRRAALLAALAARIDQNHPPLKFAAPPAGWCSWYCFGARVTAKNVMDNRARRQRRAAAQIRPARRRPSARDGRLWRPATRFGGDVQASPGDPQTGLRACHLGRAVHRRSRQPPLPGIPIGSRRVGRQPLSATRSPFRLAARSWYALDGTNPEVQKLWSSAPCAKNGASPTSNFDANFGAPCTAANSATRRRPARGHRRGMRPSCARGR